MNNRIRNRIAGSLAAAATVAALGLAAAPAAQAQTAAPASLQSVNCSTGTFGTSGNQQYFNISCSATGTTKWWVNVSCSDGSTRTVGPYTTFLNVRVFCPPNTNALRGWVSYTN
ncbi:hypothetical protein ACFYUY_39890 [Kitasatospora sp. NPDC004745]|uniref:hypothetical protein n=1 Tax=Kitasatospora sp. NPDC004745 TaxID=3364019 RepID=UPI00368F354A